MNPNEINQNPNGTASQVNTGVSSSTVNTVPVQQPAPQVATPVAPVAPAAPQEVVPTPVASPVAPTPVVQEVTPAPIAPQVAPSPAPTPTPIPTTPVTPAATPMPTDPNAQIKPVNMSGVTQTQELPPQTTTEEPTVITTKKKRGSNIVLVLVIAILIVFAFNIDKALEYYENYLETGSLTKTDVSTDSLTNGFILINEATSNIKVNNIKFRNFKKGSNMTISFNYESPEKYDNPESMNLIVN